MTFNRVFWIRDQREGNFSGRGAFEREWNLVRTNPMHRLGSTGIIDIPVDHPDHELFLALYRQLEKKLSLYLEHDKIQTRFTKEDWRSFEFLEAMLDVSLDLSHEDMSLYFDMRRPCSACNRTEAKQIRPFALDAGKCRNDFGYVGCGAETNIGCIVSCRGRELLENLGADVTFSDVLDAKTDRVSHDLFQLNILTRRSPARRTVLLFENQCPICKLWDGIYRGDSELWYSEDLYFERWAFDNPPIALSDVPLGKHRCVTDMAGAIIVSAKFFNEYERRKLKGVSVGPAYVVDTAFKSNWGGVMLFGKNKLQGGDWQRLFDTRLAALEARYGKADDDILHSTVPLHLGGYADVLVFRHYVSGIAYITSGLIGYKQQMKNELGAYELMMCTREPTPWAGDFISRLARYTTDAVVNPGQTMDIAPAVPQGSAIRALLFTTPESFDVPMDVLGIKSGVLLCIGITAAELAECMQGHTDGVLADLAQKGIFPFTDLMRS